MKILPRHKNPLIAIFGIILVVIVIGYSNDEAGQKPNAPKVAGNSFGHAHDFEVTDLQKHKFEHEFAEQCVRRELLGSTDKLADEAHWQKPCLCIASYLMKGLTASEAERFLDDDKSPQSLIIKYQAATYHCIEAKVLPKAPNLFGRPQ
jgi:hypothetical protein